MCGFPDSQYPQQEKEHRIAPENEHHRIGTPTHRARNGTVGRPRHGTSHGKGVAHGVFLHMLPHRRQIQTGIARKHRHDADHRKRKPENDPPLRLLPIKKTGKQHRETRPKVIHHTDFRRLSAAVARRQGKAKTHFTGHRHPDAADEEFPRHLCHGRHAVNRKQNKRRDAAKQHHPQRLPHVFRHEPHKGNAHPPANGGQTPHERVMRPTELHTVNLEKNAPKTQTPRR